MAGIFPANATYDITGVSASISGNGSGVFGTYVNTHIDLYSFKFRTNSSKSIDSIQVNFNSRSDWSGTDPTGNFNYGIYNNNNGSGTPTLLYSGYDGNGFNGYLPSPAGTIPTVAIGYAFPFRFHADAQRSVATTTNSIALEAVYNIQTLNPATDFLLVDSTLNQNIVLLPSSASVTIGKLFYIKDTGGNALTNKIVVACNTNETINSTGSTTSFNINANYGCLTIVSDGSQWRVLNYYPSTDQPIIPFSTYTGSTTPASLGSINIFRTDTPVARETGDNCVLRNGSPPAGIWIVIYAGRGYTNNRNSSNRLFLRDSTGIDGYTSGNYPYLSCDGTAGKTIGAVLMYDGTKSYIVGWYNPNAFDLLGGYIGTSGAWAGGNTNVNPSNNSAQIGIIPTANKALKYRLSTTLDTGEPCFFNINKLDGTGNSGAAGNSFSTFTTGDTVLNNSFNGISGTSTATKPFTGIRYPNLQTNMAVWFISVPSVQLTLNSTNAIYYAKYLGYGEILYELYNDPAIISNIRVGAIVTATNFYNGKHNVTNGFIRSLVEDTPSTYCRLICFNPDLATDGTPAPAIEYTTPGQVVIQYSLITYPVIGYTPRA